MRARDLAIGLLVTAIGAACGSGGGSAPACHIQTLSGTWVFHYVSSDGTCQTFDVTRDVTGYFVTGSGSSYRESWSSELSADCRFERTDDVYVPGGGGSSTTISLVEESPTLLTGTVTFTWSGGTCTSALTATPS